MINPLLSGTVMSPASNLTFPKSPCLFDSESGSPAFEDDCDSQLPTVHEMRQRAIATSWGSIRSCMLDMCTRNNAMPPSQVCTSCFMTNAEFRCLRCGPLSYYCVKCLDIHSQQCVYHLPEIWKASNKPEV